MLQIYLQPWLSNKVQNNHVDGPQGFSYCVNLQKHNALLTKLQDIDIIHTYVHSSKAFTYCVNHRVL